MANIENIIGKIRLSQGEIASISSARKYLEQIITAKGNFMQLPPPKELYIIGSYKRGTKISPLDDVDILYTIGNVRETSPNLYSIIDCAFTFNSNYLDTENNISSKKVLDEIKSELASSYSRSEIKRNNEVVNLYLTSYNAGFDIIPAFYVEFANIYLIPLGSNSTKWKKTNPKIDEKILDVLNTKHNQLLKNVIRVIKYWFRKKKIKSLRSYHLEAIVYHLFTQLNPITTYLGGVSLFFRNINFSNYLSSCPDPTNISENLSSDLTQADIITITTEANNALTKIAISEEEFVKYVDSDI